MNLLSIWLVASDDRKDDRITFTRGSRAIETVNVKYTPGDTNTTYSFILSRANVRSYLGRLFRSLPLDQDPWEKVQITPATGPAIMYHVNDLETAEDIIMETIDNLLYTDVEC
jgi:hypothetical protein